MIKESKLEGLKSAHEFFNRSTRSLTEDDSNFVPREGMMTPAQQIAHVAHTFDWFIDAAFSNKGFRMDFDNINKDIFSYTSIVKARAYFESAYNRCCETIASKSDEQLAEPLPENPVMGQAPKFAVVDAIIEHTAHHRGSLAVYARLLGKVPPMPYGDM